MAFVRGILTVGCWSVMSAGVLTTRVAAAASGNTVAKHTHTADSPRIGLLLALYNANVSLACIVRADVGSTASHVHSQHQLHDNCTIFISVPAFNTGLQAEENVVSHSIGCEEITIDCLHVEDLFSRHI